MSRYALGKHHSQRIRLRTAPGAETRRRSVSNLVERLTESTGQCSWPAPVQDSANTSMPHEPALEHSGTLVTRGRDYDAVDDLDVVFYDE